MGDYGESSSFESLKLILGLVAIVALTAVAYWVFTSGPIISLDNVVDPKDVPSSKNAININEEIESLNFSIEFVSGEISSEIKTNNQAIYEKAILNNGNNWESINLVGNKESSWILKNAKLPDDLNGSYIGFYSCKKDNRILPLLFGIWDCNWKFKEI